MENILVTEAALRAYEQRLPDNVGVVCFKLVDLGSNTLTKAEYMGHNICDISNQQSSFFIISSSPDTIRQLMHNYVDRFCDLREGK